MSAQNLTPLHKPEIQQFVIELEGEPAFLEYALGKDGTFMVMHTEVPAAHAGKGYAASLAKEALAYSEAEGMKVMPYCTYMATYLIRHRQQWEHLFAPDFNPS
jgi:uncharacterized protein